MDTFREAQTDYDLWADIERFVVDLSGDDEADVFAYMRETAVALPTPLGVERPSLNVRSMAPEMSGSSLNSSTKADEDEEIFVPQFPEAFRAEIENIKDRYIVGKIVGRDVVDAKGHSLARQGERITRQLVKQVEEAGKLVALIEYMTFDSFEDEIHG